MMSIVITGCTHTTVQNLNYDYATHYVVDLTVESVTENSAVVYVPDSYDYEIQDKNVVIYGERSPQTGEYYWTRPNHPYGQINEMLTGEVYRTGAGK